MGDVQKEPWEVTAAPYDDPDIAAFAGPEPAEPRALNPGCYWRLRPGEPLDEVRDLPRHQPDQPVDLCGGPQRRLVLDQSHGRRILAVPAYAGGVPPEAIAHTIVAVDARHRATGHINDPDRFLIVLDSTGAEMARSTSPRRGGSGGTTCAGSVIWPG